MLIDYAEQQGDEHTAWYDSRLTAPVDQNKSEKKTAGNKIHVTCWQDLHQFEVTPRDSRWGLFFQSSGLSIAYVS